MHGRHLIRTWSKQQSVVAVSSAEAELYAASKAGSEGLGLQTWLEDLGWRVDVQLHMDSASALSLIQREGLGRAKHIEIQYLWLQEAVRRKRLGVPVKPEKPGPSASEAEQAAYIDGMQAYAAALKAARYG